MENVTVRIVKTPEFNPELYLDICYYLQTFDGPIEFIEDENLIENPKELTGGNRVLSIDQLEQSYYGDEFYDDDLLVYPYKNLWKAQAPLSDEARLLGFCAYYKHENNIQDDGLVVLLTTKKFSNDLPAIRDSHKNIIIAVAEWDKYPEVDTLNPVVHLIVKTILKSIANAKKEKIAEISLDSTQKIRVTKKRITSHEVHNGCVNDKADNHFRVLLKLNNTEFCRGCTDTMLEEGISKNVWQHGLKILSEIAKLNQGKNKISKLKEDYPLESTVLLFKNNAVYFKDLGIEVRLTPMQKTLYVLFLINLYENGTTIKGIPEYKDHLLIYYGLFIKYSRDQDDFKKQIDDLAYNRKHKLETVKSSIKRRLIFHLGEVLGEKFSIQGEPSNGLAVKIPKDKILVNNHYLFMHTTIKTIVNNSAGLIN